MKPPPTNSVLKLAPATDSATIATSTTSSARTTKPTVPAVAGSIRRRNVGPANRPKSRAIAQPMMISAIATKICSGVVSVPCLPR